MIIAGDINQLLIKNVCLQNNLLQLVNKPMAIVVNPQVLAEPERKYVCFRDVREHRKIKMEKKMAEYDWSTIASVQDIDTASYK